MLAASMPTRRTWRFDTSQSAAAGSRPGKCRSDSAALPCSKVPNIFHDWARAGKSQCRSARSGHRACSLARAPSLGVIDRRLIVGVGHALLRDVDARGGTGEPLERHLIDGLTGFQKMSRCVEVGAAVFRARDPVGGVVAARLGNARVLWYQLEAFFGRPGDRLEL